MKVRSYRGYVHGFTQPSVAFELPEAEFGAYKDMGKRLWRALHTNRANSVFFEDLTKQIPAPTSPTMALGIAISLCLLRLLDGARMPLSGPPVIGKVRGGSAIYVAVPVYDAQVGDNALRWIFRILSQFATDETLQKVPGNDGAAYLDFLRRLDHVAPPGANGIRMLRAAQAADIPYRHVADGVHVFGWGASGRWLRGTVSDETPGLSRAICSDKQKTKEVLFQAGLPIPPGALVSGETQATEVAEKLGYPVVVKPADRERGEGVFADLATPEAMITAYRQAAELSSRVLIEKFIKGTGYRAHVYHGEIWVLTVRQPAGVTGDGENDITALVTAENAKREQQRTLVSQLNPIQMDAEALDLLQEQSLEETSVPEAGRFVRLKRASNASTGGQLRPLEEVPHPENEKMIKRAASVLRMDMTALDIITTDITKPWYETDMVIIEANSGPQLSMLHPELDQKLLESYVPDGGRLRAALVLTSDADLRERLVSGVKSRGEDKIGLSSVQGAVLGDEVIFGPMKDLYGLTGALVLEPRCKSIVVVSDGKDIAKQGLPLDRFDKVAVAGWDPAKGVAAQLDSAIRPILKAPILTVSGEKALLEGASEEKEDADVLIHDLLEHLAGG